MSEDELREELQAQELAKEFELPLEAVLRTMKRYKKKQGTQLQMDNVQHQIRGELRIKSSKPCLVAINIYSEERACIERLQSNFISQRLQMMPFFSGSHAGTPCAGVNLPADSNLTWGEVLKDFQAFYNAHQQDNLSVIFLITESLAKHTLEDLEMSFQETVVKEGIRNIVGFVTGSDGRVPLTDYYSARLSGDTMRDYAGRIPRKTSMTVDEWRAANSIPDDTAPMFTQSVGNRINVFGNDPATAVTSRQDKANVQRLLATAGLSHIRSVRASTALRADELREAANISFPVVVKPVSGAGSEFVFLCRNSQDMVTAFKITENQRTTQNTEASDMVVEDYIEGDEYIVDTISFRGVPVVTDVWESWKDPMESTSDRLRSSVSHKMQEEAQGDPNKEPKLYRTTNLIYDKQMFVQSLASLPADSDARRVTDYTLRVLDVLGLRNFCSHCELRIDRRPGSVFFNMPILIELNPRPQGDAPRASTLVGYDQFSLFYYMATAAAIYHSPDPSPIRRPLATAGSIPWPPAPQLYENIERGTTRGLVFLRAKDAGVLCGIGVIRVMQLPSYCYVARGALFDPVDSSHVRSIEKTMDLFSSPGAVVLEGSREQIDADMKLIREMEAAEIPKEWLEAMECIYFLRLEIRRATGNGNDCNADMMASYEASIKTIRERFYDFVGKWKTPCLFLATPAFEAVKNSQCTLFLHVESARTLIQNAANEAEDNETRGHHIPASNET